MNDALEKYSTFKEWFKIVEENKKLVYPNQRFPNEECFQEYLNVVEKHSVANVKRLLRVLLKGGTTKFDITLLRSKVKFVKDEYRNNKNDKPIKELLLNDEVFYRVKSNTHAWEGLSWILYFLPVSPSRAIDIIHYYIIAQGHSLPDDTLIGLSEAIQIIEKRFIEIRHPKEIITSLTPIEFECVINKLFRNMEYETEWTKATRDGGNDIIAEKIETHGKEHIYIECKRYIKTKLTVETVKAFAYTVLNDKVNKGIIFCTGYVPKTLKNIDARIEIIDYEKLNSLLNCHWGDWTLTIETVLSENSRIK